MASPETSEPEVDLTAETQEAMPTLGSLLKDTILRAGLGGLLMGLANLVPGISGGTMLLAVGIYPKFIGAIAEVSTFKFKKASLVLLGVVVTFALTAILLFAGPVKTLVVEYRWIMYSLFIGLTLGGVPVVWKMVKPATKEVAIGAVIGFLPMVGLAFLSTGDEQAGFFLFFVAGVAGASAMILPGISGGYLLLVLGVYVPILSAIDAFKNALKAGDLSAAMDPTLSVVLPVGLGVLVGVLGVSNLMKHLLHKHEKVTLGALLGLLVGSVLGLWPFQAGIRPSVGDQVRGRVLDIQALEELSPEKYPTEYFTPDALQVVMALVLVLVGFFITVVIARFGDERG